MRPGQRRQRTSRVLVSLARISRVLLSFADRTRVLQSLGLALEVLNGRALNELWELGGRGCAAEAPADGVALQLPCGFLVVNGGL